MLIIKLLTCAPTGLETWIIEHLYATVANDKPRQFRRISIYLPGSP